jgi:hypothetical protein
MIPQECSQGPRSLLPRKRSPPDRDHDNKSHNARSERLRRRRWGAFASRTVGRLMGRRISPQGGAASNIRIDQSKSETRRKFVMEAS